MKEFIEKLIGRLENEADSATNDFAEEIYKYIRIEKVKKIVNQIAEEYAGNEVLSMMQMNNDFQKAKLEELKQIRVDVMTGGWIPCSERLPELETDVFICTKQNGIAIASLSKPDIFWTDEEGFHILDVIAWQPLPLPYQPKGE